MKRKLYASFTFGLILLCLSQTAFAQYPYYFSSGNFNPPNSWNQSNAYRMGTVANTNIQADTATAVGNCYFRFFSANSGGTIYEPSGNLDSLIPLNMPFALATNSVINKAYYFQTFNLTDNYVFKTSGSGAPGNSMAAVIRIQGPIQYVTALTQSPAADVYPGENVTVTATLSDTFSAGQGIYLRYSLDNWATSTVIPMTGSGTQYSATLGSAINVSGAAPNYYIFTSGAGLTIAGTDADLMTVNLYNNNFNNFTYYVDCPFALSNTSFQMLQTDKARYNPSDIVNLTATFQNNISGNLIVKYWHLGDSIGQSTYAISNASSYSWTWPTPSADYSGYFVQATLQQAGVNIDSSSIAVDVSSQYSRFPRYGFLSQYSPTDSLYRNNVFSRLNRYHLNGIQFYDVNHKHDVPLAGTVANPDTVWNDIANRENYLSTVLGYIRAAHRCNMKAMNYNLLYGAWSATAAADGVSPTWGLYYDVNHTNQWGYTLPASWASNLSVENPADTNWQNFIFGKEADLFQALPYDGWHIDQLGNPGTVYDYNGNSVNVGNAFAPYITAAKSHLNVNLVMNAVTNYGQQGIATTPVDFLYTEVWDPYRSYNDLVGLIAANNTYSSNKLSTVFAAYMNQPLSGNPGTFNTPGILLADAAIFSAGGAHIELGDHMLDNPYFPNSNLRMSCGLEQSMIRYYDFATAYENLLRDSLTASATTLQTSGATGIATTATLGKIWVQSTQRNNTQIFQLINLLNANTLNWRDSFGTQPAPTVLANVPLRFIDTNVIVKLYCASPDNNGIPVPLSYTRSGDTVIFTLPHLQYWTMIVAKTSPRQAPIVRYISTVDDSFTVWQASKDTFNVTANDTIVPAGDSACISLLSGGSAFSVINCRQIVFHPDSVFTGLDTCRYALCDTSGICDTAMVVIRVNPNAALLPVASFKDDSISGPYANVLSNCMVNIWRDTRVMYQLSSTSLHSDSILWRIRGVAGNQFYDSVKYFKGDTINFVPDQLWSCNNAIYGVCNPSVIEVCITAYNQFGSNTWCDTSCQLEWEGINEIPFASINVYPNPFSTDVNVSIDASRSSRMNVTISDALGRMVYQTGTHQIYSGKQNLILPLSDQPDGLYFWSIETETEGSNTPNRIYGKIVKQ